MKIGIFGGSFNPPHNMHENIGKELLKRKYLDSIIYVPTGIKYEYKDNLLPNKHRFNMLKLMTAKEKKFSVSDHEFKKNVIYTYETLDYFKKVYKVSVRQWMLIVVFVIESLIISDMIPLKQTDLV